MSVSNRSIPTDSNIAQQGKQKQRLLMLTHRVPYPPDRGDRIRAWHMLEHLSSRFDVSLACTSDEPVTPTQEKMLRRVASRVAIQQISPVYSKVKGLTSLLTGGAITPACFYRRGLAKTIRQWHQATPFDTVLTFCTSMIRYARVVTQNDREYEATLSPDRLRRRALCHVIDLVDVDSAKWLDYAQHSRGLMRWIYNTESKRLRQIEAGRFDFFDGVAVVSDAEAGVYREQVGNHAGLTVVRQAVDVDYFKPLPPVDTKTLVFIGVLNYRPNADGICWFVEHVMPLLSRQMKGVRLKIVGRHATAQVKALGQRSGVEVVGAVADVRDYLREATAVIAPLRIARGVQTKVLEAMASRRAVVCSSRAAEGIDAVDGQHLLVADTPGQWAYQLQRILTDSALRAQLTEHARLQIEQGYQWKHCLTPLNGLLENAQRRVSTGLDRLAGDLDTLKRLSKAA